jgi:hypothetical protein
MSNPANHCAQQLNTQTKRTERGFFAIVTLSVNLPRSYKGTAGADSAIGAHPSPITGLWFIESNAV